MKIGERCNKGENKGNKRDGGKSIKKTKKIDGGEEEIEEEAEIEKEEEIREEINLDEEQKWKKAETSESIRKKERDGGKCIKKEEKKEKEKE